MNGINYDAVVLSGGRGTRLGGVPKAGLLTMSSGSACSESLSLLERAVAAASGARRTVVVGDGVPGLPPAVCVVRESPPFGGPAAALGAGFRLLELDEQPPELVLVLACDMPNVGQVVDGLLAMAMAAPDHDGVLAVDRSGRAQYLAAVYRFAPLGRAILSSQKVGLDGMSMRTLLQGVRLAEYAAPDGATDDIDEWDDAARMGVFATGSRDGRPQIG